ncbi:MAG: prenyltransferase/squalene oxidase repeat-containing protein [Candidatus Thorarchaeota archaeon]
MIQKSSLLTTYIVLGTMFLLLVPIAGNLNQSTQISLNNSIVTSTLMEYTPTVFAEPIYDSDTLSFIKSTRNIDSNNVTSTEQIYFKLGALRILDPTLSNLSTQVKDYWISQLLSFQRSTGGFGHWKHDRSGMSATHMALQSLSWLGYSGLNTTLIKSYLDRNQNSLTDGFNSYLSDTDSDVHATYLAIKSYQLIGEAPDNTTAVIEYFKRAQNGDGGFGLQTNNEKGIYWTSKITVTQDAIFGLNVLGDAAVDPGAALDFIKGLQLIGSGGFVNDMVAVIDSSAYTAAALETIYFLGDTPVNATSAKEYIYNLENLDGSFRLSPTSIDGSLRATYYSVFALSALGYKPTDVLGTIDYVLNTPTTDGYGGVPGESPTLRETFDAVYSHVLLGEVPTNKQGIINFVAAYRNPDGGYGTSKSFTESTLRALEIYNLLGDSIPNPSETITFLKSLQLPSGGFVKATGETTAYIVSTYRAVRALQILGNQPDDSLAAIAFIKGIQNGDGGFGGFVGDTSDVTDTYRAVSALNILGSVPTDTQDTITFLQNSQNLDGGFRRSVLDTVLPKNVSNIIHTYSAMRALNILDANAFNISTLYNYLLTVKNFDGGYAEHPQFTSDNSYTFVTLYLLRNFHVYSGFKASIEDNLNSERTSFENYNVSIGGVLGNFEYNITNWNSTMSFANTGVLQEEGQVVIDTSMLVNGTYTISIFIRDPTSAQIQIDLDLLINRSSNTTTTTSTTTETSTTTQTDTGTTTPTPTNTIPPLDMNLIIILGGIAAVAALGIVLGIRSRKK